MATLGLKRILDFGPSGLETHMILLSIPRNVRPTPMGHSEFGERTILVFRSEEVGHNYLS